MEMKTVVKRRGMIAAGLGALATVGIGTTLWLRRSGEPGVLAADLIEGDLPLTDPLHKAWRRTDRLTVQVLPQQMFYPRLAQPSVTTMNVRALYNGKQLGFHLEWGDEQPNELESIVTFRDAVAAMIPINPAGDRPPVFMGMTGKPVYIMQWKASWQKDVNEGFQDVEKSYPRWYNDVYPGHPEMAKLGMTPETAKSFYPGLAAGNIMSQQKRSSPVEEAIAEGYGTLTSLPTQRALGKGLNEKGRWKVTFGTPVGESDLPTLQPGAAVPVAFAVWDGGKRQVGGRKHYVDWIQVTLPGS